MKLHGTPHQIIRQSKCSDALPHCDPSGFGSKRTLCPVSEYSERAIEADVDYPSTAYFEDEIWDSVKT